MTNIQKHLENQHKRQKDVAEIIKLKKDKDLVLDINIKKQLKTKINIQQCMIRNKGDHLHNTRVLKMKRGELLLSRRRQGDFNSDCYGSCPQCLEWIILRDNYSQHKKTCPSDGQSSLSDALVQNLIIKGNIQVSQCKEKFFQSCIMMK